MRILLVNDDGIDAPLLAFVRKTLEQYGTVHTVAPKVEQSGKSMALTMGDIPYEKIDERTYMVDGTPTDCVSFALHGLNLEPQLVVSGINRGYNLGMDTKYSGTVGAALQASYDKYDSIAFSADHRNDQLVRDSFRNVLDFILENDMLSPDYILNVNFPLDKFNSPKGIKDTRMYFLRSKFNVEMTDGLFKKRRKGFIDDIPKDSDIQAVNEGYVSISKLSLGNDC